MTEATPDMEIKTEKVDDMEIKTEKVDDMEIKTKEEDNMDIKTDNRIVYGKYEYQVRECKGCKKLFTKIWRHFNSKSGKCCLELYTSQDLQEIKQEQEKIRKQHREQYRRSEKGKAAHKVSGAKYRRSEKCQEKHKICEANYRRSEKGREKHKIAEAKYRRSEKGKEKHRLNSAKYRMSEKGKEKHRISVAKYRMSEKGRETRKLSLAAWRLSEKGQEHAERERKRQQLKSSKIKSTKMLQSLLEVDVVKPMSQTNYLIWETLFLNFLKMDKNYTPFLDPNKTWTSLNHDPNRGQSNEDTNNLDNNEDTKNLDNLIITLASYGPELLHQNVINECTSVRHFFDQVCNFYKIPCRGQVEKIGRIDLFQTQSTGAQPLRSPMFLYNKLRNNFKDDGSRSYEDFYLELRTAKYEALMKEDSGMRFTGSTMDEDIENEIVIDWLEGIDQRLPDFIEQDYSSELQTISLHDLQDNISKHLDSHLLLLEFDEKVRQAALSQPHEKVRQATLSQPHL